jgi:hypothetical protein
VSETYYAPGRMIELVPAGRVAHIATKVQTEQWWASRAATALCGVSGYFRKGDDQKSVCRECARRFKRNPRPQVGPGDHKGNEGGGR